MLVWLKGAKMSIAPGDRDSTHVEGSICKWSVVAVKAGKRAVGGAEEILHGLNRNVLNTFNRFDETVAVFFLVRAAIISLLPWSNQLLSIHSRKAVPGMDTAS